MMRSKKLSAILVVSLLIGLSFIIRRNYSYDIYSITITSGIEDLVIDLGQLAEGHEYEYAINLVNNSGIPFQIGRIISSCGCTNTELSTKTLDRQPVELLISVNTTGKLVKLNEKISLIEADPGSRLVNLLLTGVLPDDNSLYALPPLLQFITSESENTHCLRRFSIKRRNNNVISILSFQSDVEWASVSQLELKDVVPEIDSLWPVFEVRLDVTRYHRATRKEGTITIVTKRNETISIPLIPNLTKVGDRTEG